MSKKEVLAAFEADFANPGTEKSGEYLLELPLRRARRLMVDDRPGVVEACRHWISLRQEPYTTQAVAMAKRLRLTELGDDLETLRADVVARRVF